jgi:3',5'-cyclic AMP phosphodiesterase CpdA
MQAHDGYIAWTLGNEIRQAARRMRLPDDQFDAYVITGDISTDANSTNRFRFAREFITSTVLVNGTQCGLNLPVNSVVAVPGNHDKMYETTPERYTSAFNDLPAEPPYRFEVSARNGQICRFFGIDSNRYDAGNIAVGRISPQTLAWLSTERDYATSSKSERHVDVLVLHHHPCDLNPFGGPRKSLRGRFTRLEEGERVLRIAAGWIDLIMHGHEHFPVAFVDPISKAVVVSAGTVSQRQNRGSNVRNSFHAMTLRGRELSVVQFDWNRARFIPVARHKFQLQT